jgi:NAD(P)-dependent dehydrogenase (short-subunit alcohol dehydrogenase family)
MQQQGLEPTDEDIRRATQVLQALASSSVKSDALSELFRAAKHFINQQNRQLGGCGIRLLRDERAKKRNGLIGGVLHPTTLTVTLPPNPLQLEVIPKLVSPQQCYVCKVAYDVVHHFYDRICCKCADTNFAKRLQTADLSGKRAVVTGGRIKIGFEIALKLLRAGAYVVATTRFLDDALERYKSQEDYDDFADRLHLYQLDMLDFKQLTDFAAFAKQQPIDVLINNAAQTIYRPPEFYQSLKNKEEDKGDQLAMPNIFFPRSLDEHGIQVDYRPQNTWTTPLEETPMFELLQVTAVNYVAPFYLMKEFYPAFAKHAYVVNVTAMEGKFHCYKTGYHVHTNAAKAALNMITRTVGEIWAKQGIYVACVDTGWVTNEYPINVERDLESKFHPPLDEIDGAARVLDPIFCNLRPRGLFYKDYCITNW